MNIVGFATKTAGVVVRSQITKMLVANLVGAIAMGTTANAYDKYVIGQTPEVGA